MTDNVTIPASGTGTATPVVATDDVAGVHYQRVKLVDGTLDSATAIPGGANGLKVDPSSVTSPVSIAATVTVSGTVTANAGTGTLAVSAASLPLPTGASTETTLAAQSAKLPATLGQKAMTASLAVVVASDQSTIPVSNASLPLPSGASTAAKQPALGTAGTASADVITVQGVASMTPLATGLKQTRISVTPTVSTSPAYTAKDAVGGLLTFSNAARVSGGTITIQTALIIDNSQQMPALDLVLFDRTFTASTDNAIFNPSDADLANIVGVIPVTNWADFSTNSVATRFGLGHAIKLNGTDMFGQLVTRSTPTFVATNDIIVILEILQD